MPLIISFSRSMSAGQSRLGLPTLMQWTCRLADFVQGVGGGDEHLLRRAAPVGAGPAEIARLDHDHPHPGSSRRHRDAEGAVAAADDQNVARFAFHLASPSPTPAAPRLVSTFPIVGAGKE
jgi:hypothetical protein